MTLETSCILLAIIAYLAIVLGIGVHYAKRNESTSDFYLGGRKLGPFVTAMSAEASDMSSYLLMGLPGLAYLTGICDVGWTVIGLAVGTYLNWLLVAKRLRIYTHKLGSFTIPAFFSDRYHDQRRILSTIAAAVIIIFFIPYTASGFAACGKLFGTLFGVDYIVAMLISAIIIIAYTAAGGFLAASTSDFIQSIVMSFALLFILCFAIVTAGGPAAVAANANDLAGYISMSMTHVVADGTAAPYTPLTIVSTLAWGLGYFGMPHILLRFMAIEDDAKLKVSRRVASVWVVVAMAIAILIGVVGNALSAGGFLPVLVGSDSEKIIIQIAQLLSSHGVFASLLAGIVLAGILASTMSTADSQLLAASSSISQNVVAEALHINLTRKQSMLVARATVVVVAMIGIFIARDPNSSIFGIVSFAWAGFGAAFGPMVLCALFWKRANLQGSIAGMVTGGAMVFIWKYWIATLAPVLHIYELLPAFVCALVVTVIVSLLTPAPDASIQAEFDEVQKELA